MHVRVFDRFCTANALWIGAAVLFGPLITVYLYQSEVMVPRESHAGEATVGIAVVIRATVRRFMRSASGGLVRTTVGALGRASARTATRRMVKAATRVVFASVLKRDLPEDSEIEQQETASGSALIAVTLGAAALMLSFWGVLQVASEQTTNLVLRAGKLGVIEASIMAGIPLVVYALLHNVFGRMFGVKVSYKTEFDGLLLQGYFTGAGSFLPMTTDVDYAGTPHAKSNVAVASLLGMLGIHVALLFLGQSVASDQLEFLGSMFLIYAFIYVFPITPLEGKFIWTRSKWLWFLIAAPVLYAFVSLMPPEFGEIL